MAFRLNPARPAAEEIRRAAREQIDRAIAEAEDPLLNAHLAIHQIRKRCKKMRGLVRLVREPLGKHYARENARYRDLARDLAGARDTQSVLEALDRLETPLSEEQKQVLAPFRQHLEEKRDAPTGDTGPAPDSLRARAADHLRRGHRAVNRWPLDRPAPALYLDGLTATYRQGRKTLKKARKTGEIEAYHEWRKHAKYHGFHLQLLQGFWPAVNKAWRRELTELGEHLGQEHDLSLVEAALADYSPETDCMEILTKAIARERDHLRHQALRLGGRIFAEKPGAFRERWRAYAALVRGK